MAYFTYGAIVVGSQEMSLKVYEVSPKIGIRQIDYVNQYMDISKDAYSKGKLDIRQVEIICENLLKFKEKLAEYNVRVTECMGTSAIRSLENREMIVHQIKLRTGYTLTVPSNSEMRLLMYKGITLKKEDFNKMIEKNTAILDIGSSSLQISLFDKQALTVTQNVRIGTFRTQNVFSNVEKNSLEYFSIVEEYIEYELNTFRSIYLKEKAIKNVIVIGDSSMNWNKIAPELGITDYLTQEQVTYLYKKLRKMTRKQIAMEYGVPYEVARYMLPSIIVYKNFLEQSKAEMIWLTRTNLCDGMVVDYAQRENKVLPAHDFDQDIVMAARNLAKRYRYNKAHTTFITELSLNIFDHTRRFHGLGKRERLLLELACLLHECGKFINMNEPGVNGYQLIMSTEIIGLSHRERRLLANIVLYNTTELPAYEEQHSYNVSDYLLIGKLTAILRLANVLDRSHKQKLSDYTILRKGPELVITGTPMADMTLEASLLKEKADFFEEIYGIRPILRQKRGF
ncbi:MAG: exopolyphosphatase [Lachnospiraceae bacterium]|nr:exopolyphosphatase [Lachnospiraceae bacterium]